MGCGSSIPASGARRKAFQCAERGVEGWVAAGFALGNEGIELLWWSLVEALLAEDGVERLMHDGVGTVQ